MRQNGVRSVIATCANCGRSADVNVDLLPETLTIPDVGQRLRCSHCGGKTISTRPAWHTGSHRPGTPDNPAAGGQSRQGGAVRQGALA
jgi:DNA-directed RNA polymerase subunit RPC12/RpoP